MTFYNPLAFIFAITLPGIIILYLLKQRHQDYEVASIRLWQEVLHDIEANVPWQKLKKNLLMLLQLAAMLMLIIALARPFIDTPGGRSGQVIIVLDTSVSMQATDTSPSRFEAAKKQAARYIGNLKPGTLITLISMGSSTVIEENLNNDKSRVLDKLRRIKVTNSNDNREEAASLIESMLKQQSSAEVVCFSDKPFNIEGLNIGFFNAASGGDNFSIISLSQTRTQKGITALGRIANYSNADATIPVTLYVDGNVFDARTVRAAKNETVNVYWSQIPEKAELLECRIDLKDALKADNTAWNAVNRIDGKKAVLVSKGNIFIEKAVSLKSGIQLLKTEKPSDAGLKGYDLYIYDGMLPEKLPEDGSILVFNPPVGGNFEIEASVSGPILEKSVHSLMNYVDSDSFAVARTKTFKLPEWAESVISSDRGVIAFAGTQGNKRVMVCGFDLHQSELPVTTAFPIMMTNILDWLVPTDVKNIEDIYPGTAIEFNLDPKTTKASVNTPNGSVHKIAPPFPADIFDETWEIGKYALEQNSARGTLRHYFTVNVPAALESDLTSPNEAPSEEVGRVSKHSAQTGLNMQGILLWAVLLLLCLEWWVYTHGI